MSEFPAHFWSEPEPFQPFSHAEPARWCRFGYRLLEWATPLIKEATDKGDPNFIKGAKFLLTEKYHEYRVNVTRQHRDNVRGHFCIYHAYLEAYDALKELSLAHAPLELLPPAMQQQAPQEPAMTNLRAAILGEVE